MMKKILSGLIISCLVLLAGCWDSREINELGLVMAVGIDKATDSDDFIVTAQISNQKSSSMQGTSNNTSENIYVVTAQGKTLFDAVRQLSKVSSKRIMWAHNYIVIIGERMAKDGVAPVVNFFTNNTELRLKTAVVVSEGDAKDYLAVTSGTEDIPGVSLENIYDYSNLTGEYIKTDMIKLSQCVYSEYQQPLLSKISFKRNELVPGGSVPVNTEMEIEFGGSAAFYKDKMLGWLTPDETRGLAWLIAKAKITVIPVEEPTNPGKYVSVEIHSLKTKIISDIIDGKPVITLEVKGMGDIAEEDAATSLTLNEFKKEMGSSTEQKIMNDISTSLYKIQKVYKSDLLGLAKIIHGQHNDEWEKDIKQRWEQIYPEMQITVNVDMEIYDITLFQIPEQEAK